VEEGLDPPPPLTWDEFARDLRLTRRHTRDIHVFSLEGCVEQGYLERLEDFDWGVPTHAPPDALERAAELTRKMKFALRALDRPHVASLAATAAVVVPIGVLGLAVRLFLQRGDDEAETEAPDAGRAPR
jgi:hypothetical protein